MDVYGKIANKIKEICGATGDNSLVFPAKVKSVKDTTCTVLLGDFELTDVRLRAVIDNSTDKILITPKIGSHVLVCDLSGGRYRDLAVLAYSEPSSVEITIEGISINVVDGKISINNSSQSLYNLLTDLIDAITALTVTTPHGTSGTPINSLQFNTIKTKLGQLMLQ